MKKITLILTIVLAATGVVLSLVSSGEEYAAEKLLYRALKTYSKIAANPDVAPPGMLARIEKNLDTILKKYGNARIAKTAHITLVEFYLFAKRYDKALATIAAAAKYKDDIGILSRMQFMKGLAYEKQDQWGKALREYAILRDEYSMTPIGLQAPLYIARYYDAQEMQGDADDAYNKAIVFYRNMEKKNRNNMIGYVASNLLMQVYINQENYEKAGKVVEATINNYPPILAFKDQLPNVEIIYVKILKQPEKAIAIFNNVKEKVKDDRLKKLLQNKIEIFERAKSSGS